MSFASRLTRALIFTPLFSLPRSVKLKMVGGEEKLSIAGRTLDIDTMILAKNSAKGPQLDRMPPEKARALFHRMTSLAKGELSKNILMSNLVIPITNSAIQARLYTPGTLNKCSALMVYFHGGGNVIGDLDSYDVLCADFAEQMNIRVLSVDYRLAPEHKFPTAAKDAFAAYCWARDNAQILNINKQQIILAGDSAGGYLSSVVSLQAIQNNMPLPKAQLLIYPMTDMRMQTESYQLFAENLLLTRKLMAYFIGHYLNSEGEKTDPLASPLLAADDNLKKMPRTILTVAGFDPLHDEGLAFYEKLKSLGVKIQLLEHNDLTHGFVTLTGVLKRARAATDEIIGAAKSLLD